MAERLLIKSSDYCFACGKENPIGFRLDVKEWGDGVKAQFKMRREYEGYHNLAHGGIIATLLDELIVWACRKKGYSALTAELNVRFKKALYVGEEVEITGRVLERRKNLLYCQGEMRNKRGELVAYAKAKLLITPV